MVKIIAVHFHLACNWVKTWLFQWSSDFYLSHECWYPNVCVLYTPYDVFKASCSKSEKLLCQAEFLMGETVWHRVRLWSAYEVSGSSIQLACSGEDRHSHFLHRDLLLLTSGWISVTDSDNYPKRCLAFPALWKAVQ